MRMKSYYASCQDSSTFCGTCALVDGSHIEDTRLSDSSEHLKVVAPQIHDDLHWELSTVCANMSRESSLGGMENLSM